MPWENHGQMGQLLTCCHFSCAWPFLARNSSKYYIPSKHLFVLKISRHVSKTSSTRLWCNNSPSKTSWKRLAKTPWRRFEDALKDEKLLRLRRLEDVLTTRLEDVLKTCLEHVLKTNKMFTGNICIWQI